MFRRVFHLLLLLSLSLLLWACPYESDIPVSSPSLPLDEALFGEWEQMNSKDYYKISRKTQTTYSVKHFALQGTGEFEEREYSAFISKVDGVEFLNVHPESDKGFARAGGSYLIYKVVFSDKMSKAHLYPLSDYIDEHFTTEAEFRRFIYRHHKLSFFYGTEEVIIQKR